MTSGNDDLFRLSGQDRMSFIASRAVSKDGRADGADEGPAPPRSTLIESISPDLGEGSSRSST
ncbi:MAG: hypothetical protein IPM55_13385 [Acidobacteria bacterium]|nr:hypothetical protein [Acidobacteriota bacterium]